MHPALCRVRGSFLPISGIAGGGLAASRPSRARRIKALLNQQSGMTFSQLKQIAAIHILRRRLSRGRGEPDVCIIAA